MAKRKKKTTHRRTHHRRRVGAIHMGGLGTKMMKALGFVAGHIGGGMLQRSVHVNPKLVSVGEVGVGFAFMDNHHPLVEGAAWGLLGAGSVGLAQEFHVISGIDNFINGLDSEMNGGGYELDEGRQNGISNERTMHGMYNEPSLGCVG